MDHLMTAGTASHERAPSYDADFKTKFKKKSAKEHVEVVKENGEWKVAKYMIFPD